jgi:hypothetical protein
VSRTAAVPQSRIVAKPSLDRKAAGLPIIIAEWPRNTGELVRISLDCFNSCFTIDIRSWWRDANGVFKPKRDGLTLAVTHLSKLADGLHKALQRAELLCLVEPAAKIRDGTVGVPDSVRARPSSIRRNGTPA